MNSRAWNQMNDEQKFEQLFCGAFVRTDSRKAIKAQIESKLAQLSEVKITTIDRLLFKLNIHAKKHERFYKLCSELAELNVKLQSL